MADDDIDDKSKDHDLLLRIARELTTIRQLASRGVNAMGDAEEEIPERIRRFTMYFHDMHDFLNMYHELGLQPPPWVQREVERCADRLRQLLKEEHSDLGKFEKIRQKMADDPENRYDQTKRLFAPKEPT